MTVTRQWGPFRRPRQDSAAYRDCGSGVAPGGAESAVWLQDLVLRTFELEALKLLPECQRLLYRTAARDSDTASHRPSRVLIPTVEVKCRDRLFRSGGRRVADACLGVFRWKFALDIHGISSEIPDTASSTGGTVTDSDAC